MKDLKRVFEFIDNRIDYFESGERGVHDFEYWIEDELEINPLFGSELREAALSLLTTDKIKQLHAAVLILGAIGNCDDIPKLAELSKHHDVSIIDDADAAIECIKYKNLSLEGKLDHVTDKKSFMKFVHSLIDERIEATKLEKENPDKFQYAGALGWENSTIPDYLGAALIYFWKFDGDTISWRDMAKFLYLGKIYE